MITFEYHPKGGLTFAENMAEPFILECMAQSYGYYPISSINIFYALKSLILEEKIAPYDVQMLYLNQRVSLVHHDEWQKPAHLLERVWCYYRSIMNEDKSDTTCNIQSTHSYTLTINYNLYNPVQRADGDMYRQLKQELLLFQNQPSDKTIDIGDELEIYVLRALVVKNYIPHKNLQIVMPYTYVTKTGEIKEGIDTIRINADGELSTTLNQKRDGIKHGDNIHHLQKNTELMKKLHRQMSLFHLQEKLSHDLPDYHENTVNIGGNKQKI
jgi:hypothetical protein